MMLSEVIKLGVPVVHDGHTYSELTMRRCKVKDRKAAQKQWNSDEDRETGLIANLCEIPVAVIDELDAVDYNEVTKVLRSFLGLNTGI